MKTAPAIAAAPAAVLLVLSLLLGGCRDPAPPAGQPPAPDDVQRQEQILDDVTGVVGSAEAETASDG